MKKGKKYTSGPRYWNVPVLVNTGTFLVYQYCPKMWYLRSLEHASVIQKLTILEHKNDLVLSNTRVPVSGTWSLLFPNREHLSEGAPCSCCCCCFCLCFLVYVCFKSNNLGGSSYLTLCESPSDIVVGSPKWFWFHQFNECIVMRIS